jgi:hypothetical protein
MEWTFSDVSAQQFTYTAQVSDKSVCRQHNRSLSSSRMCAVCALFVRCLYRMASLEVTLGAGGCFKEGCGGEGRTVWDCGLYGAVSWAVGTAELWAVWCCIVGCRNSRSVGCMVLYRGM